MMPGARAPAPRRTQVPYDVIVVAAGPFGLTCARNLRSQQATREFID